MTINYSKVLWFLIIFLIWNIVSANLYYRSDIGNYIYVALWIIWFSASLVLVLLYIFDSKRNKNSNIQSRVVDLFASFILALASIFLFLILFAISAAIGGISLSGGFGGIGFIAAIPSFFILLTPLYFFVIKNNWPPKKILGIFFAASFFVFLLAYSVGK